MQRVEELPATERIGRYREMAEHTRALAGRVKNPDLRDAYLELADRWAALADSTQRDLQHIDGHRSPALRRRGPESI